MRHEKGREHTMSLQQPAPVIRGSESVHRGVARAAANDERRLVAEARSGCSSAFEELYERHRPGIYRRAIRILRNQQDAEDAVQRSFQHAFANLHRFRGDSSFSTWLTRIAINEALMQLRQRRTNTLPLEGDSDGEYESSTFNLADKWPTPEEALAAKELRDSVMEAISHLRKSLRTVVLLRELRGLTNVETAQHLGLSVGAVKARAFHARRHLRRHLEGNLRAPRRQRTILRFAAAALAIAGCGIPAARSQGNPGPAKAVHLIGLSGVQDNAKGTLSVENGQLHFVHGKTSSDVSVIHIEEVVTGTDSAKAVGKTVGMVSMAAPYGGGRFLSLFRKKIDTLTLKYRDATGSLHGVIFTMPAGSADGIKGQLVSQGAQAISSKQPNPPGAQVTDSVSKEPRQ
jgi:RNA polymerase sigma-70 factor, ECF subfamily